MKSLCQSPFTMVFASSAALLLLVSAAFATDPAEPLVREKPDQEYYELRIYKIFDYDKQVAAEAYLENALIPALNRMGIERVGVFTNQDDENDHSVFVLIQFPTIGKFTAMNQQLAADKEYQTAAASYFDREKKDPVFERIESRFMKAFAGMPVIEALLAPFNVHALIVLGELRRLLPVARKSTCPTKLLNRLIGVWASARDVSRHNAARQTATIVLRPLHIAGTERKSLCIAIRASILPRILRGVLSL